jgi:hypothetical protein
MAASRGFSRQMMADAPSSQSRQTIIRQHLVARTRFWMLQESLMI